MTPRFFRHALMPAVLATLTLSACGLRATSQNTGSATRQAAATPLSATNASGWTVAARAQTLEAGPTVITVSVTVKGPATVYGGCISPVTAELIGADGNPVTTPTSAGFHCLAITAIRIPEGQSPTFSVQLPAPGAGHFLIRTTVNSKPPTELPDLKFG